MVRLILIISVLLGWPSASLAYLTDKNFHAEPGSPPSLPAAGAITTDPTFGTTIMRLTDSGDGTRCMTQYSNVPAFNVTSTKVAAFCDQRFKVWDWSKQTLARSNGRLQSNRPTRLNEEFAQWSRTTYNKFFACADAVLYEITIPDGSSTTWTNTVVKDFTSAIGGQIGDAGDLCTQISVSFGDDFFGFHYKLDGAVAGYIAYRRSTNTILLQVLTPSVNEVEIDKSGRYLVTCCFPSTVWDLQGTPGPIQTNVTVEDFVHRAIGDAIVVTGCSSSRLCKRNLATPNTVNTILSSGWLYDSTRDDHFSLLDGDSSLLGCRFRTGGQVAAVAYDNECLIIDTSGTENVARQVHHRSRVYSSQSSESYWAQPRGNLSLDGNFLAFTSNMDGADVNARNDVYIANLQATTLNPSPIRGSEGRGVVPGGAMTPAPRGFMLTFMQWVELGVALFTLWRARWKLLKGTAAAYRAAGEATFTYYWRWKIRRWLKRAPLMLEGGEDYGTLFIWDEGDGCWDECPRNDVAVRCREQRLQTG